MQKKFELHLEVVKIVMMFKSLNNVTFLSTNLTDPLFEFALEALVYI